MNRGRVFSLVGFTAVLAITLAFGLWPFKFFPRNMARLSENGRCVTTHGWSLAAIWSAVPGGAPDAFEATIAASSASVREYAGSILTLYDRESGKPWLSVCQWQSGLIVRLRRKNAETGRYSTVEKGIDSVFNHQGSVRLRIACDSTGLKVTSGTTLLFDKKKWRAPAGAAWIVGVSPFGAEPWRGTICLDSGHARFSVPPRFRPPFLTVLEPVRRIDLRKAGFVLDLAVNFVGFLPFGFFFMLLFRSSGRKKPWAPLLQALLASFACSLAIELAQTMIPFRTSQLSDLVLNTIGGLAGGWLAICFLNYRHKTE